MKLRPKSLKVVKSQNVFLVWSLLEKNARKNHFPNFSTNPEMLKDSNLVVFLKKRSDGKYLLRFSIL